ncbi:hypothetical protein AB0I55_04940 [Actinocatenispora sera]|uniref:Uncharacterized protein n=1 Tax=Actinocatenispora sera TaxID=390989 RepID=A0A810L1A5_9ACTN|nr:hypothetical protein [Actinocatenispora sera]BCJ29193.1 hypothetical protein Asera_33010 [Actinocatenispora sera]
MLVRLAADWAGPGRARHRAGDLVEVDNVTLAELEAGGFVATEETPKREEPRSDDEESTETTSTTEPQPEPEPDTSGGMHPNGWPGIS